MLGQSSVCLSEQLSALGCRAPTPPSLALSRAHFPLLIIKCNRSYRMAVPSPVLSQPSSLWGFSFLTSPASLTARSIAISLHTFLPFQTKNPQTKKTLLYSDIPFYHCHFTFFFYIQISSKCSSESFSLSPHIPLTPWPIA